jgi:hypothetical protein
MVSAIFSTIMTISAVIYAYISDSMSKECLNEADEMFIASMNSGLDWLSKTPTFLLCGRYWHLFSRTVLHRNPARDQRKLSRQQREAVATRFILSLSDQQLVVGLSFLVAIAANQNVLTVSEFRIAFALAWFSVTTHLATLDGMQQYLRRHVVVRNLRVISMVILMLLFVYCFGVFWFVVGEGPDSVPVKCYLISESRDQLAATDFHRPWTFNDLLWVLIVACIPGSYAGRILGSYDLELWRLVKMRLVFLFRIKVMSEDERSFCWNEWNIVFKRAKPEEAAHERTKILEKLGKDSSSCYDKYIRRLWLQWRLSDIDYRDSMVSVSTSLSFTVVFGSLQTRMSRWTYSNFVDIREMGFGQITPLVLLFIPILAGLEGYYGESTRHTALKWI